MLSNQYSFSPNWLGAFTFDFSYLHGTAVRNGYLGFALAFPFSSTSKTISGFETYGDNQFATPITAFPVLRNQEKYQFKYDVSHSSGAHAPKFGIDFIHEPVMSGALPATAETLYGLTENPTFYLTNPAQFTDGAELYRPVLPATLARPRSLPPATAASRRTCSAWACTRWIPGASRRRLTVNYGTALGHDIRTVPVHRRQPELQRRGADHPRLSTAAAHRRSA